MLLVIILASDIADRQGKSTEQLLQDVLDTFLLKDKDAKVKIHTDGNNELQVLFFCASSMADTYRRFPEVLFFDGTYRTNVHLYALYVFLVSGYLFLGSERDTGVST